MVGTKTARGVAHAHIGRSGEEGVGHTEKRTALPKACKGGNVCLTIECVCLHGGIWRSDTDTRGGNLQSRSKRRDLCDRDVIGPCRYGGHFGDVLRRRRLQAKGRGDGEAFRMQWCEKLTAVGVMEPGTTAPGQVAMSSTLVAPVVAEVTWISNDSL